MFIYAINETHRFKMAPDGDRTQVGAVKHETLFQNSHVLAAGEVWVVNGIIVDINDESGSYSTRTVMYSDPQFARDVLAALDRGNIPASETVLAKLRNLGGVE